MDDPGPPPSEWIGAEYAYDVEGPPHAVTSVTRPTSTDTYLYDTNGNPFGDPFGQQAGPGQRMTCRIEDGVTFKQTYNADREAFPKQSGGGNRIASMAKMNGNCDSVDVIESWSYQYDRDGVRVGEYYFAGTTETLTKSYYFGGAYETHSDGSSRKYYSFAGQTVAMHTIDASHPAR